MQGHDPVIKISTKKPIMQTKVLNMAPCRPSHGGNLEKGSAHHSATQAVGREKWATARRVGSSSTSQPPETSYGTGEEMLRLRIGTANIGSMSGRSGEMIDMVCKGGFRLLFFSFLQETR